eukprot:12038117-Alexandrium_andersonii.AAC.1
MADCAALAWPFSEVISIAEGGQGERLSLELGPGLEIPDRRRRTFGERTLAGHDSHHPAGEGGHLLLQL